MAVNEKNKPIRKDRPGANRTKCFGLAVSFTVLQAIFQLGSDAAEAAAAASTSTPPVQTKSKHKSDRFRLPIFDKQSNPHTLELSPDAVQLANTIELTDRLARLKQLQQQLREQISQGAHPIELRQDVADLKLEIIEIIQQTRLDIDFVAAEIDEEQASVEEVLKFYVTERDDRVDRANLWAFRTNGVLWAAAEAITIPSYKYPHLSVPSGALGIVAGLVPSLFSVTAIRSGGGKHHERNAYPNMLSKIYNLPTIPRTEYPESVWKHLNSPPTGATTTRRDMLMEHWVKNPNIHTLRNGINDERILRLAGVDQTDISIALLNDRASMLREVRACVLQMTRPLMELSMSLRDKKQLSGRLIGTTDTTDDHVE